MNSKIYFDNAATTKPNREVVDTIKKYIDEYYNPSSLYSSAKEIQNKLNHAREIIANYINAQPEEIIFTSGGSESNSLAIQGWVNKYPINDYTKVITTNTEHKSIIDCVKNIESKHSCFSILPVATNGKLLLESLKNELKNGDYIRNLLSIQYVNNEIGTIQDVKEISNTIHEYRGILHIDAVQAFPYLAVDVKNIGIDMMNVSGHKFGCPKGIGFLYKSKNIDIEPIIYGSQNFGLRGGTENIPYIMGMAKAIELMNESKHREKIDKIEFLSAYLKEKLKGVPHKINGGNDTVPSIVSITFLDNVDAESLLYYLDSVGVYIGTGSACNSNSMNPSYVLKAIGLTDKESRKTIRVSLSANNTVEEIDKLISEIKKFIFLSL